MARLTRYKWVDIARALGIFLIVLGHAGIPDPWVRVLYAFHVPLFFFLSGYLFNAEKYGARFGALALGRARSLLIPYVSGAALVFVYARLTGANVPTDVGTTLRGLLYANGRFMHRLNIPLWFLPALFTTTLVFALLYRVARRLPWPAARFTLFGVLAALSSLRLSWETKLPWALDISLITAFFFYLGHEYRQTVEPRLRAGWVLVAAAAPLFALGVWLNPPVDLLGRQVGNLLIYGGTAVAGTALVIGGAIFLARHLDRVPWLQGLAAFVGQSTVIILLLHSPLNDLVYRLNGRLGEPVPWHRLWLVMTVIGTALPLLVSYGLVDRVNLLRFLVTGAWAADRPSGKRSA